MHEEKSNLIHVYITYSICNINETDSCNVYQCLLTFIHYCSVPGRTMICFIELWESPYGIPSLPVINTNTDLIDRMQLTFSENPNTNLFSPCITHRQYISNNLNYFVPPSTNYSLQTLSNSWTRKIKKKTVSKPS